MSEEGIDQGWWWPLNSNRAHWIGPERRSLCGKWGCLASASEFTQEANIANVCKECLRKLNKLKGK